MREAKFAQLREISRQNRIWLFDNNIVVVGDFLIQWIQFSSFLGNEINVKICSDLINFLILPDHQ